MCFCAGCPSIYFSFSRFALFIFGYFVQFQFCISQFFRTSHGLFADGYLCDIILHDDDTIFILVCCVYCDSTILFNGKLHIFGICIAIRSSSFFQRVSSAWQTNNALCSIARCPFNAIAQCCQILVCISNGFPLFCGQVIIGQGQGCSCNFFLSGDVLLVDLDFCPFILDGQGLSIFGLFYFAICCFINSRYNAVRYNKGKGGNRCESVRSCDFFQFIRAIRQCRNGNISIECCRYRIFCNRGFTNLNTIQRCMFILCSQLEFCFFCCNASAVKCFLVDCNYTLFCIANSNVILICIRISIVIEITLVCCLVKRILYCRIRRTYYIHNIALFQYKGERICYNLIGLFICSKFIASFL